jgi:hypothetical protein
MKQTENADIRKMIDDYGLKHWQVADAMGKSSWTLSVWLRKPLSDNHREQVITAIGRAKQEYLGSTE